MFLQKAWLLKLLALESRAGSMDAPLHHEARLSILSKLFVNNVSEISTKLDASYPLQTGQNSKSKRLSYEAKAQAVIANGFETLRALHATKRPIRRSRELMAMSLSLQNKSFRNRRSQTLLSKNCAIQDLLDVFVCFETNKVVDM